MRSSIRPPICAVSLVLLTACGGQQMHPGDSSSTGSSQPGADPSRTASPSVPRAGALHFLPVTVESDVLMRAAGNHGPTSSILDPSSCTVTKNTATATGTYRDGDFVPNVYDRYGDRIDLYVFTAPQRGHPSGVQLADPFTARAPAIAGRGRWTVTVPLPVTGVGGPARCMVAAQPTHDFQGAP